MRQFCNPSQSNWEKLCSRPLISTEILESEVQHILNQVRLHGDKAVKEFALKFDGVSLGNLKVSDEEINQSCQNISIELKNAISIASRNIRSFHASQASDEKPIEIMEGVTCWRKCVPIENVGIYIPGGTAPLFSSILMLAIPAQIAGCKRIVLCTPSDSSGLINPAILYTASYLGINEIYKIGGAQAIGAMAFGTESIFAVDKIFGPGNQYVTKAKEIVQKSGVAIDLPAGPSEVLIIADNAADEEFIAADLLAQAEHGTDSQVVLLSNDESLNDRVGEAIKKQIKALPRYAIAKEVLKNSFSISFGTIERCIEFSNKYAPEHLILALSNAEKFSDRILNAGSVFVGNYSCESAGDYASGTNHTLPTNGFARNYSGVSYDSYVKKITYQKISEQGLLNIGRTIEVMAEAEKLEAHKNAVTIRLKKICNEK